MDELIIDGKTYVSSKRAAKITGYAKDYVGQLCREGRVAARLVGRNWYILEDSIREHRFGGETSAEESAPEAVEDASISPVEQTLARYEAEIPTTLPPVEERPRPTTPAAVEEMQQAWKEWFEMKNITPEAQNTEILEEIDAAVEEVPMATEALEEDVPEATEEEGSVEVAEGVIEFEAVPIDEVVEDEPEPVIIHRPLAPSRAVIDLTGPARSAYEEQAVTTPQYVRTAPASRKSRASRLPVQAVLISAAGLSIVAALIGAGIAEDIIGGGNGKGIQASVVRFLEGKTVVEK